LPFASCSSAAGRISILDEPFCLPGTARQAVRVCHCGPASRWPQIESDASQSTIWEAVIMRSTPESRAEAEGQQEAFEHQRPLSSDHDARVWTMKAVAQRRGQPLFRARLLYAYGSRFAITGCSAVEVLEAAHVLLYRGDHTDRTDNGLLLRADVHTSFDCGLLWVTEERTIALAPSLLRTDYSQLQGLPLRLPLAAENHPNPAHLKKHADLCLARLAKLD
jgi:putative restriction endonuclease